MRFAMFGRSFVMSVLLGVFACAESPEYPAPMTPPPAPPAKSALAVATEPVNMATKAPIAPRIDTSLIPRKTLFSNADRGYPFISHDGKRISFLAPVDGVQNVWVGPADDPSKAKPVTSEKKRGVQSYFWTYTNEHILYIQDNGGDENWHVFAVDLKTNTAADLTPIEGVAAQIMGVSSKIPGEVLIGLNDRDPKVYDVYRVDIKTGAKKLILKNEGNFADFVMDKDFNVRLAQRMMPDGSMELLDLAAKPKEKGKEAEPYLVVPFEDAETTSVAGFDASGKTLYLLDSRGRDKAGLFELDFATKKAKLLVEDTKADIQNLEAHPKTGKIQFAAAVYEKPVWKALDKSIEPDLETLAKLGDGEVFITSRSLDDKQWLVGLMPSDGPVKFFRYDHAKKKAHFLFTNRKSLEGLTLAKMSPVVIKARDGLELVSYLTLPKASDPDGDARPDKPLPMVLFVHGGPWARDSWGYNSMHQWLSNRGYAVLSVNFRGSTGFGKKFLNAANKEWAGKMHEDLIDAVKWAEGAKIAEPGKVAIMGGSYGGYSALVGLTFTPDQFACGVDIVGPSSLKTLIATIPPYWAPMMNIWKTRVGDPNTPEGSKLLDERSPLSRADQIKKPLLIGQGANDPRVKQAESDQIVKVMQTKGIPVTYVLFADEGHGFQRPENKLSFNAVTETFLAQCLGGPIEPISDDFKGSTISVPVGAADVYALADALAKKK